MKVIDTICPGCSIQCGAQLIDDGALEIEFMKHCPVNQGKLCKFGVMLPAFYSQPLSDAYIDGKAVPAEEALSAAASALKSSSSGIVVSLGDSTCEELLAGSLLASEVSFSFATGLGATISAVGAPNISLKGCTFDDIEKKRDIIIIDTDPYVQYPLLARRLQNALKAGADVTYVGPGSVNMEYFASKAHVVSLEEIEQTLSSVPAKKDNCGLHATLSVVASTIRSAAASGAQVLCLKDFANSEASVRMDIETYGADICSISEAIESGRIRSLVLMESPIFDSCEDGARLKKACESLEALVIIQSGALADAPKGAIVIPADRFYCRKGSLLSVEGKLNTLSGDSEGLVGPIGSILEKMGKEPMAFAKLTELALGRIDSFSSAPFMDVERLPAPELVKPYYYHVSNPFLARGMSQGYAKRCGEETYGAAIEASRFVVKGNVAPGVVLVYDKDPEITSQWDGL